MAPLWESRISSWFSSLCRAFWIFFFWPIRFYSQTFHEVFLLEWVIFFKFPHLDLEFSFFFWKKVFRIFRSCFSQVYSNAVTPPKPMGNFLTTEATREAWRQVPEQPFVLAEEGDLSARRERQWDRTVFFFWLTSWLSDWQLTLDTWQVQHKSLEIKSSYRCFHENAVFESTGLTKPASYDQVAISSKCLKYIPQAAAWHKC